MARIRQCTSALIAIAGMAVFLYGVVNGIQNDLIDNTDGNARNAIATLFGACAFILGTIEALSNRGDQDETPDGQEENRGLMA